MVGVLVDNFVGTFVWEESGGCGVEYAGDIVRGVAVCDNVLVDIVKEHNIWDVQDTNCEATAVESDSEEFVVVEYVLASFY